MLSKYRSFIVRCLWILLIGMLSTSCGIRGITSTPALPSRIPSTKPPATQTPTTFIPSPTPVKLAAKVNGEEITLAEFEDEVARFQASQGGNPEETVADARQKVLDNLVDLLLLAQGAREAGFKVDENLLGTRWDGLVSDIGGEEALNDWIANQGYTKESFKQSLGLSIEAAWMRDEIASTIPATAKQVHARQILLYNSEEAQNVLTQLKDGKDFATLASAYDPSGLGDLGWFPQGYLSEPLVEQAAFSLQLGEYSDVIETQLGFHIIQVIEIDPERPLDPGARLILQEKALSDWLDRQHSQAKIEVMLP
jgi:hypothetical protein